MKTTAFAYSLLLPVAALCAATPAFAATPAGQVAQLSGFAMALKPGGGMKVLGSQSPLEVGDTLATEQDSYGRLQLVDGSEVILGPNTRVLIQSPTSLLLSSGQMHVTPGPAAAGKLTVEAGGTTIDASRGSALISYVIDPQATLAQRAYARASMASAATTVRTDADAPVPVWEAIVAQATAPRLPGPATPPGLYVSVTQGQVVMSNPGGSQQFTTGQFGYVRNSATPPVPLPSTPTLSFNPPPSFAMTNASGGSSNSSGKAAAVDCEVR